ncbi:hypothetical protein MVEG_03134 [Podila verticillata NRRL 6337]|nr:hypothetical protein MVEG_03134 [Podila verticillata NRRL 6337]
MSYYGATTRGNELHGSLNGQSVRVVVTGGQVRIHPHDERRSRNAYDSAELGGLLRSVLDLPVDDTYSGRVARNIHKWMCLSISLITLTVVLGLYYYNKNKTNPPTCESDRSYPATIFLSIFLGFISADRFYLGYFFVGLLKFCTAGGFGLWWVLDAILIIVRGLPDHNGCALVTPF